VKDVETGHRGFLVSGDDTFLESFELGLQNLPRDTSRLRQLTRDNPRQQRRLDELGQLIEQKVAFARDSIQLKRSGGYYVERVQSGAGRRLMDRIRRAPCSPC
jgi:CHASE3 domain sensor protein